VPKRTQLSAATAITKRLLLHETAGTVLPPALGQDGPTCERLLGCAGLEPATIVMVGRASRPPSDDLEAADRIAAFLAMTSEQLWPHLFPEWDADLPGASGEC
jgi:hypothetical protein